MRFILYLDVGGTEGSARFVSALITKRYIFATYGYFLERCHQRFVLGAGDGDKSSRF
jgi:hypothetical protein